MNIHKKIYLVVLATILLSSPLISSAQELPKLPSIDPVPSIDTPLPEYLKWVFDAGIAIGFGLSIIAIIISGIYFIISPASIEWSNKAKEWFSGAVSGLLIFMLLYLILVTINPELAIFKIGPSTNSPGISINNPNIFGVYLYENGDCAESGETPLINIITDSNYNRDNVGSVKVIPDSKRGDNYFAIIYDKNKFEGKCQIINSGCSQTNINTIRSIFVGKYNNFGIGKVTFYRNPYFNRDGGYAKLQASPFYENDLKNLYFNENNPTNSDPRTCTVPKDEQNCKEWNQQGKCVTKSCPNLEDNNISSIETTKNYIVILSYKGLDDEDGTQTFCQTYPSLDDINKIGPKQIKWDLVNNIYNFPLVYYPNHIQIISVKE